MANLSKQITLYIIRHQLIKNCNHIYTWKRVNRWLTSCLQCLINDKAYQECIKHLDTKKYQTLSNVINMRIQSKKTTAKFKEPTKAIAQRDEEVVANTTSEKKRKEIHLLSQLDHDFCKKLFKKN